MGGRKKKEYQHQEDEDINAFGYTEYKKGESQMRNECCNLIKTFLQENEEDSTYKVEKN